MLSYSIIIPLYNEAKALKYLIPKLEKLSQENFEIILVDDGSNDGSWEIIKKRDSFISIKNESNLGKGKSIINGSALVSKNNIILFDSDLEIDITEIPKLINSYEKYKNKVLIGIRWDFKLINDYNIHFLGNYILTGIFNFLFKKKYRDVLCCIRVIDTKLFKSLKLKSRGFGIEVETLGKLAKNGIPTIEHKVSYKRRSREDGKKIKFAHAFNILIRMIKVKYES